MIVIFFLREIMSLFIIKPLQISGPVDSTGGLLLQEIPDLPGELELGIN